MKFVLLFFFYIIKQYFLIDFPKVVVFDDIGEQTNIMVANKKTEGGSKTCKQLAIILQYLECPQYLRRILFPIHNFLKYTGVLNPLDAPHHFRQDDNVPFR